MKNISIKVFPILLTILLVSCFELEQVDPNKQNEDSFWTNQDNLDMGVIGCYDVLQDFWGGRADNLYNGLSDEGTSEWATEVYETVRFRDDNLDRYNWFWRMMYDMIGRGYQVVDRAPDISGAKVPELTAEGRFFIALGYYHLQNIFGDHVAYVDRIQGPSDKPRRAEVGEIYNLIEEQLLLAIPDLPIQRGESQYGRITKGTAQAMLGKVYMQQHKYPLAEEQFKAVIDSKEYALNENFEDNFINLPKVNPEAVFIVHFVSFGSEGADLDDFSRRPMILSMREVNGTFGDIQSTNLILTTFEKENDRNGNPDPRLDATIFHPNSSRTYYGQNYDFWAEGIPNPEVSTGFYKYSEQALVESSGGTIKDGMAGTNFNIIRYADVLLLYAEALNANGKTSEAYAYVDMVRERSNMNPLSTAKPGLDQTQFLEQLKDERVTELAGELVRLEDIKRWGMYNSSNTNDPNFEGFIDGKHEVGPIPQSELDLNANLIQNPNY